MRILFMGTPDFARAILEALTGTGDTIVGAVTQTDKPQGRKMILTPSPVKVFAEAHSIPVFQPKTLKDGAFEDELKTLDPELIVVAAYGKILPPYVIHYPKYGCVNAHASLLPKYRGAAPIQRAIIAGEKVTGVTAMYMDEGLDTGDMILKESVAIEDTDDFGTLHDKLAGAGCRAILTAISQIRDGTVCREKQDDTASCYAAKITNEDCRLDFSRSVTEIRDRIRGLSPFPLAAALMPDGRKLKIISAAAEICLVSTEPGTVIETKKGTIDVACANGILHVTGVQPEGKGRMGAADFINGRRIRTGDVLRTPEA